MEHVPNTESEVQKVCRIAKELDISIEDAAVTCDGFELAFSNHAMRGAIFGMIDQLDDKAARKGEPSGLIINYTVELGVDGIRVGRYADEIPAGELVDLTPTDRAMIFLKINDNFPTQEFLGPMIVNRPELPSLAKEGWQTDVFCRADGVVCSAGEINKLPSLDKEGCPVGRGGLTDSRISEPEIRTHLPSEWTEAVIHLGPIRLTFNERFPFIYAAKPKSQPARGMSQRTSQLSSAGNAAFALPLPGLVNAAAASHPGQSSSGLSPPLHPENLGHSHRKMFHPHLAQHE
jgi:hypothetical protein